MVLCVNKKFDIVCCIIKYGATIGGGWRSPVPETRHSGAEILLEATQVGKQAELNVMKAGSCATMYHEPGQVRKEAAISGSHRVPQGSLAGAGGAVMPRFG